MCCKKIIWWIFVLLSAAVVYQCAHPVMPTGGDKDIIPAQPLKASPPNYSTNFIGEKIVIDFDEFIQLENPQEEIFVSPPLEKKATYKVRGKSLVVELNEILKENTTYTIFFGNAIVDLTEKNPTSNFEYVFSTGDVVDSLSIAGTVMNAFNHEKVPDILAMLYADINDSIPFDSLPYFVKPVSAFKTGDDGSFQLNNLKDGKYLLFALEDVNSNYIYDMPNERIAFSDSLVSPYYIPKPIIDSLAADSLASIEAEEEYVVELTDHQMHTLMLFGEVDSTQRILDAKVLLPDKIAVYFRIPPKKDIYEAVDTVLPENWYIKETSINGDSVDLWLYDVDTDTLFLKISDDTLVLDTARFVLKKPEKQSRRMKKKKITAIKITPNFKNNILDLNKELILNFPRPVVEYDENRMLLIEKDDTLDLAGKTSFSDAVNRKLLISHAWKEKTSYSIFIPDSVFIDKNGNSNDTTVFNFRTRQYRDYGLIRISTELPEGKSGFILQLMNQKEAILEERYINESAVFEFDYLLPGNYIFKAIHDKNGNKKWDTGNFIEGLQPETVQYYPNFIEVRANWELQETWHLQ